MMHRALFFERCTKLVYTWPEIIIMVEVDGTGPKFGGPFSEDQTACSPLP